MRLGPLAILVVFFCSVTVPSHAQTLEVCNNGTVVVEVVVASEQNHVVYSWVVDGRPVAPGACVYLLKSRFQANRRLLPQDADKWTYAKNSYDGLTRAFGQAPVQAAAHAVHTAAKRLLTGSVMNQQALGATRNEPFEAFEDILARKDPRGYVKAAIAFKENLYSPGLGGRRDRVSAAHCGKR